MGAVSVRGHGGNAGLAVKQAQAIFETRKNNYSLSTLNETYN